MSGGTYILTSTPNDRFLRNFFIAALFTLRVFARNLLRGSRRRNIFHISFLITDLAFASNNPTHYILDHGDTSAVKIINFNNAHSASVNDRIECCNYTVRVRAALLLLPRFGGTRSVQRLRSPMTSQRAVMPAQVSFWY